MTQVVRARTGLINFLNESCEAYPEECCLSVQTRFEQWSFRSRLQFCEHYEAAVSHDWLLISSLYAWVYEGKSRWPHFAYTGAILISGGGSARLTGSLTRG
jgi:hypothetical protein